MKHEFDVYVVRVQYVVLHTQRVLITGSPQSYTLSIGDRSDILTDRQTDNSAYQK